MVEDESGLHYLRPETAQGIFLNFANVVTSQRMKPPFGIAQTGKSFRNEITPGNFIFRTREFEQMEMEFFVKPGEDEEWHQHWIDERTSWYVDLGISRDNLRHFEHPTDKLSHYSKRTVDIEYRFGFAGSEWGELEGIANRTDFDLRTHSEHSGVDLSYYDQAADERYLPYVIEPAAGLSRSLMTFLVEAYQEDEAPEHQGRGRQADRAAARPAARARQGRGAAAVPQRRPLAQGEGPRRGAAPPLERRLRRLRRDRPPLPPPGRDRHAVLRHRGLRDPRGPRGHRPRARLDGAGAGLARRGDGLRLQAPRLTYPLVHNDRMRGLVGAAVLVWALTGCSGSDEDPAADASSGDDSSAVPTQDAATEAPYLPVPDGVELTAQGSDLEVGDTATVAWEPRKKVVGALAIKVTRLEKASLRALSAFRLEPAQKRSTPVLRAHDGEERRRHRPGRGRRSRCTPWTAGTG